jgi:hypothetical protein
MTLREIQQTAEKLAGDLPMMATGYFTVRIECKAKRRMVGQLGEHSGYFAPWSFMPFLSVVKRPPLAGL